MLYICANKDLRIRAYFPKLRGGREQIFGKHWFRGLVLRPPPPHLHLCPRKLVILEEGSVSLISFPQHNVRPSSRNLLDTLTVPQQVKKLPAVYGTQLFITVLTTARHLPLFCFASIQLTLSPLTSVSPISIFNFVFPCIAV